MSFAEYQRSRAQQKRWLIRGSLAAAAIAGSGYGLVRLFGAESYEASQIPLLPGTNFLTVGGGGAIKPRSELVNFFSYGNVTCYRAESTMASWRKTLPGGVTLRRLPMVSDDASRMHARMYFAAEKMGLVDELHMAFYQAIHLNSNPLLLKERILEFVSSRGYSKTAFGDWMDGAYASERFATLAQDVSRFRVQSLPAMVINASFYTDPLLAGGINQMLDLSRRLIDHTLPNS